MYFLITGDKPNRFILKGCINAALKRNNENRTTGKKLIMTNTGIYLRKCQISH